jgi:uncharacterized membrane protein YkoI
MGRTMRGMTQVHAPIHRSGRALGKAWAVILLMLSLGLANPAHARRDGDHERAREAVQAGEVMPLRQLLEQLEREHAGQVLEIELERAHGEGRWIYEIRLLQADGQLVKRKLDARTGAALERRGQSTNSEPPPDHENPAR